MRYKTSINHIFVITLFLFVLFQSALGGTIYVDANATGANNGSSWQNAYIHLQNALLNVSIGDEIWVAKGVYRPDSNSSVPGGSGDRDAAFNVINGIKLLGGYPSTGDRNQRNPQTHKTILSGDIGIEGDISDNSYHIISANSVDCNTIIDGFTIKMGNADGGYPELKRGGGAYIRNSQLLIRRCSFLSNEADWEGAGLYLYDCNCTVINCSFMGNKSDSSWSLHGGGVFFGDCVKPKIINCIFSGNIASYGAGLYSNFSYLVSSNNTFSNNIADDRGGGMYLHGSAAEILNCIAWGNEDYDGMGEWSQICWDNSSFLIEYCCVQGWSSGGTGNINTDPCFVDANGLDGIAGTGDDNLQLYQNSPCIDAGDSNSVPVDSADLDGDGNTVERIPFDLDSKPRIIDNPLVVDTGNAGDVGIVVDMGAYEDARILNIVKKTSYGTIQAAIDDAVNGDIIVLYPSVYTGQGNRDIQFMGKAITIRSTDPNDPNVVADTVIDAQGASGPGNMHRGFFFQGIENEDSVISGLTITNGYYVGGGGGVNCNGASPTITNCVISNNTAAWGGGIFLSLGPIINCTINNNKATSGIGGGGLARCFGLISDCNISNNTAANGGGLYDVAEIINCEISNNEATSGSGGGIYYLGNPESGMLENSVISGNVAFLYGGGIYCQAGFFSEGGMHYCEISNNTARNGGGLFQWNGTIIEGCFILNNTAYETGGGICFGQPIEFMVGTVIVGNYAPLGGGGIMESEVHHMYDCDISFNYSPDGSGGGICGGGISDVYSSRITDNIAGGNGGGIFNCGMNNVVAGIISNNISFEGEGGGVYGCPAVFNGCLISGNRAVRGGGMDGVYACYSSTVTGNRASNGGGGIAAIEILRDSIFWNNQASEGSDILIPAGSKTSITYCNILGGSEEIYTEGDAELEWGVGNIDVNPLFAEEGTWDDSGTPEDANDDYWIDGDYYLKSEAGRWEDGQWVYDSVTSRCVGAACPLGSWQLESRHNLGVYGGTAQESKTPSSWSLLADMTNDGTCNNVDFAVFAMLWLNSGEELYADFNRDGMIDFADFALLAQDWLAETIWYQP